jgi:hypothetical protein
MPTINDMRREEMMRRVNGSMPKPAGLASAATMPSKPPSQVLGTGLASMAARALGGRKAQIDAASNYADGGMVKGYANGGMVKDYMDGGMVKGPGTGTSDSIKAMVPVGSYVMPADSTKAMGFKPKARQINVSNGEMIFNPKQVQAIGADKLDAMKDATHTPAKMKSTSSNYADGGFVTEEERRRMSAVNQIPGASPAESSAAARGMAERGPITGNDFTRNLSNTANAIAPVGGAVAGPLVSRLASGAAGTGAVAGKVLPYGAPAAGLTALSSAADTKPATPAMPAMPVSPVSSPAQDFAARTTMPPPAGEMPNAATPTAAQPGLIRRIDRPGESPMFTNLADDQQGFAPGFTGRPSAQNNAAAEALAQRGAAMRAAPGILAQRRAEEQAAQEFNRAQSAIADRIQARIDGERKERSLRMDAEQLKPGARTALKAFYERQQQGDELQSEGQRDQARFGFESAENRADRELKVSEGGANRALQERELGDNMQTNAVRRDAAGVELANQQRIQKLQDEFVNADTDEKREAAARKLQALSGRQEQANRFTVVPQGSSIDPATGMAIQQPAMVFNNQTGQFVQPGGQQATQSPPTPRNPQEFAALPSGTVFIGPDGKQYRKD